MEWKIQPEILDAAIPKRAFTFCCKPLRISAIAACLVAAILVLGIAPNAPRFRNLQFNNPTSVFAANSTAALPLHRGGPPETAVHAVCAVIVIGDDDGRLMATALPFPLLRRIFRRVLGAAGIDGNDVVVGLTEPDLRDDVLVMVDYPSVACKMARDALGPAVRCQSFRGGDPPGSAQRVSCGTLVVGRTEKYVQQACAEWTDNIDYQKLEVVDLDAPDPAAQPPVVPNWRPTVVTAFSRNHFKHGLLLLRSLGAAAANPAVSGKYNVSVVAWTMEEFTAPERNHLDCVLGELHASGVAAEARRFPFEEYPRWMRLNASLIAVHDGGKGEYAWKALMAAAVLRERGFILWLDAGGRVLTPVALTRSLDWVKGVGFGGLSSEGTVQEWTHPGQLKYLRADTPDVKAQRNCDASRFGFTLAAYAALFRPWYECSITRQCIAPDGSDRWNHRQDQAALSVLSHRAALRCVGLSEDIVRHTDNYGFDFYGGVGKTKCYEDPLNV